MATDSIGQGLLFLSFFLLLNLNAYLSFKDQAEPSQCMFFFGDGIDIKFHCFFKGSLVAGLGKIFNRIRSRAFYLCA